MLDLHDLCARAAPVAGLAWLDQARAMIEADPEQLPVLLPQLPRRLGREYLSSGERRSAADVVVDTGAWRACDAGALALLRAFLGSNRGDPTTALFDLHERGDLEERTMLLRSMACLPIGPWTGRLLAAVQRTNQVVHFAAGAMDSNLVARTLDDGTKSGSGFGREDFERLMLKLAFLDLPLARVFDVERHATAQLSRMLQGLATEREAAGRKVWHDTGRLIGFAPTDGTRARLIGGLEHGDDEVRLAAAEGVATLGEAGGLRFVEERLAREDSARVLAALERARDVLKR